MKVFISSIGMITATADQPEVHASMIAEPQPRPDSRSYSLLDFKPAPYMTDKRMLKSVSRVDAIGLAAIENLRKAAALVPGAHSPARFGLYVGAPPASPLSNENYFDAMRAAIAAAPQSAEKAFGGTVMSARPTTLLTGLPNNVLCYASMLLDAKAGNSNYTSGEASGQLAVLQAARRIKRERLDAAVAGGFSGHHEDVIMGMLRYNGFLKQADASAKRFAIDPAVSDGTVVAEGSVFMLLENERAMTARGGKPIAEFIDGVTTTSATGPLLADFHMAPAKAGLTITIANAGIRADQVGLVFLAQSGVTALDKAERQLTTELFATNTAVATTARVWGNLMEAGGLGETALIDTLYKAGSVPDQLAVPSARSTIDRTKPYVVISRPSIFGDWTFLVLKRV